MDQYLNNRQNEILQTLLANPADTGQLYISNLQSLVSEFPQSGLLHALLAHATGGQNINTAAAYFSNKALFKLLNSPDELAGVTDGQIISSHLTNYTPTEETTPLPPVEELTEGAAPSEENTEPENYFSETTEPDVVADTPLTAITENGDPDIETSVENNVPYPDDEIYEEIAPVELQTGPEENYFSETGGDIDHPEELAAPAENEEEESPVPEENTAQRHFEEAPESAEPVMQDTQPVNYFGEDAANEALPEDGDELKPVAEEEPDLVEAQPGDDQVEEPFVQIDDYLEEAPVVNEAANEDIAEAQDTPVFTIDEQEEITSADIDDEVFDEITAIEDIRFSENVKAEEPAPLPLEAAINNSETVEGEITATASAEEIAPKDRLLDLNDEAEKLIVGNIAATDYFMFDRAISERRQDDALESDAQTAQAEEENQTAEQVQPAAETNDLSKYHDDKMPYTFMWWLDKTRKEHAGMYQPYVNNNTRAVGQSRADELQQQYYENIFHLNSVEELDRSTTQQTIEFDVNRKEDIIIQRFIVEEPHIKPPSSDKLDNENKAKKSAEDQDEMVTETLARIYTDQMLYHKAINTYKKLVLKFPEKSRYFADQIEQLQRKIN